MTDETTPPPRPLRGLAKLSPERRREIAALGGKASRGGFCAMPKERHRKLAALGGRRAHANGHTHEWDSDEAREAGKSSHPPARATVYRSRSGRIFTRYNEEAH